MTTFIETESGFAVAAYADIVGGAVLPDGRVLTGRIGCFYEGNHSGYVSSDLGKCVAIGYPDGEDSDGATPGYCYAEVEDAAAGV